MSHAGEIGVSFRIRIHTFVLYPEPGTCLLPLDQCSRSSLRCFLKQKEARIRFRCLLKSCASWVYAHNVTFIHVMYLNSCTVLRHILPASQSSPLNSCPRSSTVLKPRNRFVLLLLVVVPPPELLNLVCSVGSRSCKQYGCC